MDTLEYNYHHENGGFLLATGLKFRIWQLIRYFCGNNRINMRFIQAIVAFVAFIGYILYQLFIKRKRLAELKNDLIAIGFFALVWGSIYYWISN